MNYNPCLQVQKLFKTNLQSFRPNTIKTNQKEIRPKKLKVNFNLS